VRALAEDAFPMRWLAIAAFVIPLFAQSYTGSIGGRVIDLAGLPISRVAVTVTEDGTNARSGTITNASGDFIVSYLKPGIYRVEFTAPGFKAHLVSGVLLQIDQRWRLDPTLEVGSISEVIQVVAPATQVDYVSPEIGQVIDADQLVNLPMLATNDRGRSPFLLSKLVPGVTSTVNNYTDINDFSLGGGRRVTNEILVDGLPTTNPSDETYTYTPSPDAVQAFRVITTPFSAEYGHTGGGVMIASSKSGTNALHGSVYDLFRNRLLNARDVFSPSATSAKYVQNDPGGTIGGPVVIPHVYNGKSKTFFLVDFQRHDGVDRGRPPPAPPRCHGRPRGGIDPAEVLNAHAVRSPVPGPDTRLSRHSLGDLNGAQNSCRPPSVRYARLFDPAPHG